MKHVVRKCIWDYEKEEGWLNQMSAQGMALVDYSWCRYVFEDAPVNEYTYRIELLENYPTHANSISYLRFLEENGVEVVATYMRWVYLRKKYEDGAFDIYSDIASRLSHYRRVHLIYIMMMMIEFTAGGANLVIGVLNLLMLHRVLGNASTFNIIIGCGVSALGFFFLKLDWPIRKKMKLLRQEQMIRE